jgi:hypothetical protein
MTTKIFSKILGFFDFFWKLCSKITFVSIWPLNLQNIGLTWANFLFSVSSAFFWAYFQKNRSTFFSGNFFTWPWNIHILNLGSKLKKTASQKFYFVLSFPLQKFEWILKYNLGGDRISDGKCEKNNSLSHILEKIKHLSTKTLPQKFCILIVQVMLKLRFI